MGLMDNTAAVTEEQFREHIAQCLSRADFATKLAAARCVDDYLIKQAQKVLPYADVMEHVFEHLGRLDRGALLCIACCIDVYQRKRAGTLAASIEKGVLCD